jgi:hypothetical protein
MNAATQYAKTGVIGPEGGTLTVSAAEDPSIAGTSITILPGALSAPVTIKIGATNKTVVSSGALGNAIDFEPSGTQFAKPATMTIPIALSGVSPSHVAVMAIEADGKSRTITSVSVADGLATFSASGFTFFGCFETNPDGGEEDGGGCTPSCSGDSTCGSSDGCGGSCNANCSDGGCTPTCAGDAACGSSDGCGGSCDANCGSDVDGGADGGCTPTCAGDAACGSSDGCGGSCNAACDAGCQPKTDTFVVASPKLDILFILDVVDSPSEQVVVANAASAFFTAAAHVDYRVAVTTDNDDASAPGAEFGHLLPCSTCSVVGPVPTIISPSSIPAGSMSADPAAAFTQLWNSIPNDVDGNLSNGKHFFNTLYNALKLGPQPGLDFFRPGVFFAAITVNGDNESDSSELVSGNHDPVWYETYDELYFGNPFLFTWNYVNPTLTDTGSGFSDPAQIPAALGVMLSDTGGVALNTGDSQWTTALSSIFQPAVESRSYPLTVIPSEGTTDMAVTVDGVVVAEYAGVDEPNWSYDATLNAIVFNPNLDPPGVGAVITVSYPIVCGGTDAGSGCDVCSEGFCTSGCLEGDAPWCCGASCVDEQIDSNNCGSCGYVCPAPTTACSGGGCVCPDSGNLCGDLDAGVALSCVPAGTTCGG